MRQEALRKLHNLSGGEIDPAKGLDACGAEEIYQKVLEDFALGAKSRMDELRGFLEEDDRENFIVKTHALKSTARFLGAHSFSETAQALEEEGESLSREELTRRGNELLEKYASLSGAVADSLPKDDAHYTLISPRAFRNALSAILSLAGDFDFDEIDYIMGRLEEYALPEELREAFRLLKCYVTDVARDDIISHIQKVLETISE